jgi:sugar lactone lactonase YvrE
VRVDQDGASTMFADLSSYFPHPANDMVVSSTGAIWVGSLGFDMAARDAPQPSPLVYVASDATVTIATDGLMVPNGAVITPDGSTLIVAETLGSRLTAFTIGANGALRDRRPWALLGDAPKSGGFAAMFGDLTSSPDGIAVDAEGCVWVADPTQQNCRRIREGGEILEIIPAPKGQSIFACGLGGPSGDELLLCCAPDASERRRTKERAAVLALRRVAVPAA